MGLINDSTPPLLRGIGTLILLGATVIAFMQARRDGVPSQTMAASRPVEEETVIEEMVENRGFEWGGACGTVVIASSFFVEAYVRRGNSAANKK